MALALSSGQVRPSHEYRKWAVLTFDQMDIITLLGQAKYFFNCFAGAISGTGSDSYMSTWPIYIETVNKWSHCSTLLFIFYYLAGKLTSCGVLFASVDYSSCVLPSMVPHFVFLPRILFPFTWYSWSLPTTAKGVISCWVHTCKHEEKTLKCLHRFIFRSCLTCCNFPSYHGFSKETQRGDQKKLHLTKAYITSML